MQFQLLSFVLFAAFIGLASSAVCIGGLCPADFSCVNNVCVKNGAPCVDLAPADCQRSKANCNDSLWFDVMTKQCAKTCGRCGQNPDPECRNAISDQECKEKAYLCQDSFYFKLMTKQCAKTCKRC
ncbi:hypothetical protein L596_019913 [Steinernema carpocapsae]|uniref:ShKT domain-containing protein n=1 Tax=Steinernema carpocapsae TaxID=34508 RepID=A0A4U5MRZ9_STECR|nr:hypothetical protein L596_019913 [Steinernema carpocapsae]